ncbi:MAG: hypothetical protein H6732_15910 [Alphaproteobacteria bacterium]|nr:hypothetical protein [Alphaproteobacteria bacterium]
MSLTVDERSALLELIPTLAPGGDAAEAVTFFRAHEAGCLDELGAVPGFDQVRAGVLRLLPAVLPDADLRAPHLLAVDEALKAYVPAQLDRTDALRRHPAWVALCALELAGQRGEAAADGRARAVRLAAAGFERVSPGEPRGDGEVLWAVAEVAAEAGWDDHTEPLLEAAARAPFADPDNLGRVRLVQVLRLLAVDESAAPGVVDGLLAGPALDPQTRTHLLWIGAHLDREAGRLDRAIARLEEAKGLVDEADEPEIAARIASALVAWGVDAPPAEA